MSFTDEFEYYYHHGRWVYVRKELKGKHREYCLCFSCQLFNPENHDGNCRTATLIYAVCVTNNMVLPVWECPHFIELPQ